MARTEEIKFRIEPQLKADVQAIFAEIGLSTSEALNMFLRKVRRDGGIDAYKVPNKETVAAIQEDVRLMKRYGSFQELVADIDTDNDDEA